jgi:hypothetical protein
MCLMVFALLSLAIATGCKSGTEEKPCEPAANHCPNFCESGIGVKGETCSGTTDCGCGLFCKGATCQPYEGDNLGCSCEEIKGDVVEDTAPAPDTAPVDTGPDLSCNGKPAPVGADCNPYCQIGCDEGEQCTYTNGSVQCDGIGELTIGEECLNSLDCKQGMACFKINDDPASICRQFCQTDADCPADRKCSFQVNFNNGQFEGKFCSEPTVGCNAFNDTCAEGQACYYTNNATKCMPEGSLEKDAPCIDAGPSSCKKGLQCFVTCHEICSTNAGNEDEPKCSAVCGAGPDDIKEFSQENGLGACVPDTPPATCNIFTQEGCSAGMGCYTVTGGFACVSAGSKKPGDACSAGNECAAGSLCINSTCAELCSLSPEDEGKESHCTEKCKDNGQLSPTKWNIGFCKDASPSALCDFWAQDCEDGKACFLVSGGGTCIEGGGSTPEGGDCQFVKDCAKGLACGSNVCRKVCSIAAFPEGLCKPLPDEGDASTCEDASDCADGETCTADSWAGPPPSCEDECSNNGKEIQAIVQGQYGYCAE